MSASFENETIDKADKQYSIGTKKLNLNQNSKDLQDNNKKLYKNNLYSQNINRKKVKFNEDTKTIDVECSLWYLQPTHGSRKKWNCIIYCLGPDISFGFNTLSFLDLSIPTIPIKNIFVSSGLNLPFSKGITDTALELGWYKYLLKNRIIPFLSLKQMEI